MNHLIDEMTNASFEQIAVLVTAKLKEKGPEERRQVVNTILDAIYEPYQPKDERLERLVGYVRDACAELDEDARKKFSLQIQRHCVDIQSTGLFDTPTIRLDIDDENNAKNANSITTTPYSTAPKWTDKHKKIGQRVRILAGMHYGTIAQVDQLEHNMVMAKMADGRIVKYLTKHVKFLD